eukprot:TRINITY_DN6159_c0_g1_i1.p1 TRINITY_DN6159_c0_g1~~TRINITY_DN6159_c0_g1_i1.p1  ORF type:complete len:778 (-),score=230.46 TRINITY_DN6159_c0_g1_i1:163-2496(-)
MSVQTEKDNESPLISMILNENGEQNQEPNGRMIDRPLSAPPTITLNMFNNKQTNNQMRDEELMRQNPEYHKYYYQNKAMNPRLPPPIYGWQNNWQYPQFLNNNSNGETYTENGINNKGESNKDVKLNNLDFESNSRIHAPKPQKEVSTPQPSWNLGGNLDNDPLNDKVLNKGIRGINHDFPRTQSPVYNPLSTSYNKLNLDILSNNSTLPIRKASPNPLSNSLSGSIPNPNIPSFTNSLNLSFNQLSLSSQMEQLSLSSNHNNTQNLSNNSLSGQDNGEGLNGNNQPKINYPFGFMMSGNNSVHHNTYSPTTSPSPYFHPSMELGKESPKPMQNNFSNLVPTQDSFFPSQQDWGFDDGYQNRGFRNSPNMLNPMGGRGFQNIPLQPQRGFNTNNLPNPNLMDKKQFGGGGRGKPRAQNFVPLPQPTRSNLLEEFRTNKNKRFEIKDIVGHIVEFCEDQHGSRFIQQKLETATPEEKQMVFSEIYPNALPLMEDVFGNYVIQKFFDHGSKEQVESLALTLVDNVLRLSVQMYGCRVIQKALEVVEVDLQTNLIRELEGNVIKCVTDQNGNHVIQKCIECVSPQNIQFIIEAFQGKVYNLATHPYGCRVIQRILEHCNREEKISTAILQELLRFTDSLVQDQYGNYVIQHVLQHGSPADKGAIIGKLNGNVLKWSQHKFASNVVERCVQFGNNAQRRQIVEEIVGLDQEGCSPLQNMVKDQYGNYVVQKILDLVGEEFRNKLLNAIKPHLSQIKKYTYSKHIVMRVEKHLSEERRKGNK